MEWPLPRTLSGALGLLLEVVAKRRGAIFGMDEVLARDNLGPTMTVISGFLTPPFLGRIGISAARRNVLGETATNARSVLRCSHAWRKPWTSKRLIR